MVEKICVTCGKQYNKQNKIFCSIECSKGQPRPRIRYKEYDTSDTSNIKISSPEFSYILGFLWGDGYLRKKPCKLYNLHYPELHMMASDYALICSAFNSIGIWKVTNRKPRIRCPNESVTAILYNKSIGKFLFDCDYETKSKTSPTKILSQIPENLKHYWWRGYSDADGCFYINTKHNLVQFSLAGSFEQDWSDTSNLLDLLNIKYQIQRRKTNSGKSSTIRLSGVFNVGKFGDYIYQGCDIPKLERKWNKFLEIRTLTSIAKNNIFNKGRLGNY